MGEWLASNIEFAWTVGIAIYGACIWALKKWADANYQPKAKALSDEEQRLAIDAKARAVLASPILHEHASSTTTAAIKSAEMWDQIERVVANSVPIRNVIDARVQHGFNNFESTLSLSLTKLGDQLSEGFRKQMSESQIMYMEALGDLKEAIQAIDRKMEGHIIADEVRREAERSK